MNKNRNLVWVVIGALLVTLAGCKTLQETAQGKEFTTPEGVVLMSETELRNTLVGNTYQGESIRYPGSTYIEYIGPDGKISGLWDGAKRYQGEWVISGSIWCYKYKTARGCSTLAISGDTIYWYDLDGTSRGGTSTLLAGDPQNLGQ